LEFCIREDTDKFIDFLIQEAGLPADLKGPWEVAYEACFYRDYLHCFDPTKKSEYSSKRTFDLVLFSDRAIVVIEAKAAESFTATQARYFERDMSDLRKLLGADVEVYLVALASQIYFDNYDKIGRGAALKPFENRRISWQAIAQFYPGRPLLKRACEVYERSPLAIVDTDSKPYWQEGGSTKAAVARLEAEIDQRRRAIDVLKEREST